MKTIYYNLIGQMLEAGEVLFETEKSIVIRCENFETIVSRSDEGERWFKTEADAEQTFVKRKAVELQIAELKKSLTA